LALAQRLTTAKLLPNRQQLWWNLVVSCRPRPQGPRHRTNPIPYSERADPAFVRVLL